MNPVVENGIALRAINYKNIMNINKQNQMTIQKNSYEVTMPFFTIGVKKLHILTFIISLIFIPHLVFAQVTLYISPPDLASESETYAKGQTIEAKVLIDTRGERVGVGEGTLRFSSQHLEVTSLSKESSIFTLWVEEPRVIGNIIRFVGGVPGGFSGRGEIFTVTFRTKTDKTTGVFFDNTNNTRVLSFKARPKNILERTGEAWYPFKIPVAVPKDFLFEEGLAEGSRNIDVAYLQLVLQSEELYRGSVTGIFDNATKEAVKQFQERYSDDILAPLRKTRGTGVVETYTRTKLNNLVPEITKVKKPTLFDVLIAPEGEEVPARVMMLFLIAAGIGIVLAFALVVGVPKIHRWWGKRRRAKEQERRW